MLGNTAVQICSLLYLQPPKLTSRLWVVQMCRSCQSNHDFRNRIWNAMAVHAIATYGLVRSPILLAFQQIPNNPLEKKRRGSVDEWAVFWLYKNLTGHSITCAAHRRRKILWDKVISEKMQSKWRVKWLSKETENRIKRSLHCTMFVDFPADLSLPLDARRLQ